MDQRLKGKTMKKYLEKIQRKLYDIGSGKNFFYITPNAQATNEKK